MIGVKAKKFKCFCWVAILVALGVICSGWVGEDFGQTFLMCLLHFVVVGLIGPMMVGKGWGG
jgi:hypothetical protein